MNSILDPVIQPPKTIVDTITPKQPDTTISIGLLQLESQVATLLASASSSTSFPSQKQAEQESMIAAVLQRLQENEKKLAKEDHAKKSAALDDLARQFDKRLKLMEKERGKEATGIESELMRLQDEISRTKDAAMKQELEKRVPKLEAAQEQLMDEYEFRQEILREQQMIMRSVSYSNFYRSVQNKLQQVFFGCKVVSKGIINYNTRDSSSAAAILQYVDVAGSSLQLPPANFNLGNTAPSSSP